MTSDAAALVCLYCRLPHEGAVPNCPNCGAPLDVRTSVSRSGWVQQPPIRDMTRIQFGRSRVQVEGRQVPVADFTLAGATRSTSPTTPCCGPSPAHARQLRPRRRVEADDRRPPLS